MNNERNAFVILEEFLIWIFRLDTDPNPFLQSKSKLFPIRIRTREKHPDPDSNPCLITSIHIDM